MNNELIKRIEELERRLDALNVSSNVPLEIEQSLVARNFIKAVYSGDPSQRIGIFTVTIASPAVFTAGGHGLLINQGVVFDTSGALPTGLIPASDYPKIYYVIATGFTSSVFQVSETIGGAAVNTSGSQSGVHRFVGLDVRPMSGPLSYARLIGFDDGLWYMPLYKAP